MANATPYEEEGGGGGTSFERTLKSFGPGGGEGAVEIRVFRGKNVSVLPHRKGTEFRKGTSSEEAVRLLFSVTLRKRKAMETPQEGEKDSKDP